MQTPRPNLKNNSSSPQKAMTIASITSAERKVIRRAMQATFRYLGADFQTRLGIEPAVMQSLLAAWPIDDSHNDSDACLAVNNSLNELLHAVGIGETEALELLGVTHRELARIYYAKWTAARGWDETGVR